MKKDENISLDKQFLLNWIEETENESMIQKVKNFISELNSSNNQPDDIVIPEWQKEESARRFNEMKDNPEKCQTNFKQMVNTIFEKHGL